MQGMVSSLKRCVLYEGACCLTSGVVANLNVCLCLKMKNCVVVRNRCVKRMRSGIARDVNSF